MYRVQQNEKKNHHHTFCVCLQQWYQKINYTMSVAIYMFRCLPSRAQRKSKIESERGRKQESKSEKVKIKTNEKNEEGKRCGLLLTPHALHLLCMGSSFSAEHRSDTHTQIHTQYKHCIDASVTAKTTNTVRLWRDFIVSSIRKKICSTMV